MNSLEYAAWLRENRDKPLTPEATRIIDAQHADGRAVGVNRFDPKTVTVSIGRNVASERNTLGVEPMGASDWRRFQKLTRRSILKHATALHFEGVGEGIYDGVLEMSATFVATVPEYWLNLLKLELSTIRASFLQDSVAITVGEAEFV